MTADCPADCNAGNACADAACGNTIGEIRATFDDICDYDGLADAGARDQTDTLIAGLANYNVAVNVIDDAGADLNGLFGGLSQSLRINVNVTHATNPDVNVVVTGYRTNY